MVVIDDEKTASEGKLLMKGHLTHNGGSSAITLHPHKDLSGNPIPQKLVPVPNDCFLSKTLLGPEVSGAKAYLNSEPVKSNLERINNVDKTNP